MTRPWFFRFSVRSAILLMVVLAVGLGAWTHSARRQQRAVERIIAAGGEVDYEGTSDADGRAESPVRDLLASVVGRDMVFRVDCVLISKRDPSACVEALQSLSSVRFVSAHGARIDDEQFANLCRLPGIKVLHVGDNPITDDGLVAVRSAQELRELKLALTRVTDRGVEQLAELKSLERLNLSYTIVTDQGIRPMARLKHLEELNVRRTFVTEEGADWLKSKLPDVRIFTTGHGR